MTHIMEIKRLFIGIDPGLDGGYVALDESGNIVSGMANPRQYEKGPADLGKIMDWFELLDLGLYNRVVIFLEDVHPLPGVSSKSTWTFSENKGQIEAILYFLGRQYPSVAYQQINPKLWQKTVWQFHDRVEKAGKLDTKKTSLNCAKRLWPGADLRKSDKCKTWHDGMVDAALIAESCRRTFLGKV